MDLNVHHFNLNWCELFWCVPRKSTKNRRAFRNIYDCEETIFFGLSEFNVPCYFVNQIRVD